MPRYSIALTLTMAASLAASPAVAVEGASLGIFNATPTNADLSYTDYAGPIKISQTNRGGSIRATTDYGAVRVAATHRLTSLVDTRSDELFSVSNARWDDTLNLSFTGAARADISFWIDVSVPAPKQTAKGYRGAVGLTEARWGVQFQQFQEFGDNFDLVTGLVVGTRATRDTPLGAPVTTSSLEAISENLNPLNQNRLDARVSSVASVRPGFDRYLVTATFSGGEYSLLGVTSCFTQLTSLRIGDVSVGGCGTTIMEWGGVAGIFNYLTGEVLPNASVSFGSISGYDYNEAFTPPSTGALRLASFAASAAAVPEPDAWVLLIAGFGLTGAVARRRRFAPG